MDLRFRNNQSWWLTLNIIAWAPIYPLSACVFHMQVRTKPSDVRVIYSWSSNPADAWGNGTMNYNTTTGLLMSYAPKSDMQHIPPGTYDFDLLLNYLGNLKVLTGGALVIDGGITRS